MALVQRDIRFLSSLPEPRVRPSFGAFLSDGGTTVISTLFSKAHICVTPFKRGKLRCEAKSRAVAFPPLGHCMLSRAEAEALAPV